MSRGICGLCQGGSAVMTHEVAMSPEGTGWDEIGRNLDGICNRCGGDGFVITIEEYTQSFWQKLKGWWMADE